MVLIDLNLPTLHSTYTPPALTAPSTNAPSTIQERAALALAAQSGPAPPSASSSASATTSPPSSSSSTITPLSHTSGHTFVTPRCAIYSIATHPDGTRYATGGGDNKVKVWSTKGLFLLRKDGKPEGALTEKGYESFGNITGSASNSMDVEGKENTPSSPNTSSVGNDPERYLLQTLANHEGSVMCVKFSPDGRFLASASDDTFVMLFIQKRVNSSNLGSFGSSSSSSSSSSTSSSSSSLTSNFLPARPYDPSAPQKENWTRIKVLRGHNLDVLDLAFTPSSTYLASCSLDRENPICIWDLNPLYGNNSNNNSDDSMIMTPFKILNLQASPSSHLSPVKGLSFDPLSSYLVSSSDDPSICVWRGPGTDWGLESRIDSKNSSIFQSSLAPANHPDQARAAPYNYSSPQHGTNTIFRRLAFATDGANVIGTNCTLRSKPIAAIIGRDTWGSEGTTTNNKKQSQSKK